MGNRLSKIATRTGDDGSTGLGDGSRIRKSALRVQAMGDIDEKNSAIGVLLAVPIPHAMRLRLTRIQNHLFDLGGEICIPGHSALTPQHVLFLDEALAEENAALPPLKEFILPGGTRAASLCQLARAICRRAEPGNAVLEDSSEPVPNRDVVRYLNRLSDVLWLIARREERDAG